jgi:serine phosphatase RsbU (regulator of sigma subunit)
MHISLKIPSKCSFPVKRIFIFPFFLFLLLFSDSHAQTINTGVKQSRKADSLLSAFKIAKEDTTQINILNLLSREYINTSKYEQALQYAQQAQEQAKKISYKSGISNAYSNMGVVCWYQGNYEKALENHSEALKIRKEIGDKQGVASSYNNIGLVYVNEANYEKALENYLKSLKIKEEIGDQTGTANSYNNIGVIYEKRSNYEKALENYLKALKIRKKIGDRSGIAMSYNNVGLIHFYMDDYKKSLENQMQGLKIREEIGDKKGIAMSNVNIGNIYINQNEYEKALSYYLSALKIDEEIGNMDGVGISSNDVGICYLQQNNFEKAFYYLNKALNTDREIGNLDGIKESYSAFSDLYNKKGDYKKAFQYQKLYADIKDTILNEQSSKQMTEMNTKYESEKKDKELIKKDAEITQQQTEAEKQMILRNAFIMGFAFVLALSFFIFRGYRQKQKANKLLDEKNEKITDSINYAKRIQEAMLPPIEEIKKYLPECFVFYQPKDIVSGDFYWFHELVNSSELRVKSEKENTNAELLTLNSELLIAAVDCTGHGVPGGFMSMMGYNLLERIVKKHQIYQPAMILNELSKLVVESLRQTGTVGKINEGMDIALIRLKKEKENSNYCELEYAGAHNSLYIIRNGVLNETKANKAAIGFSLEKTFSFSNHKIQLQKGDCCYIFSDGYVDQFGGPNNEKFYYQPFRDLLIEIHQLSMEEQQKKLKLKISEWIGNKSQTDDILVIGLRV